MSPASLRIFTTPSPLKVIIREPSYYLDEEDLQNSNAYICHTNNHKRTCNENEKVFIDNMKAILAQLRSFSDSNFFYAYFIN